MQISEHMATKSKILDILAKQCTPFDLRIMDKLDGINETAS